MAIQFSANFVNAFIRGSKNILERKTSERKKNRDQTALEKTTFSWHNIFQKGLYIYQLTLLMSLEGVKKTRNIRETPQNLYKSGVKRPPK